MAAAQPGAGQKRISKEFAQLSTNAPEGMTVELIDESDLYKWNVTIDGPAGSVYEGGSFKALLTFPPTYPFQPPSLTFQTKIYHPNISSGSAPTPAPAATATTAGPSASPAPSSPGLICLPLLKQDTWKPSTKIASVLESVRQVLIEPDLDNAVEGDVVELMRRDRKAWEKTAKEWVKKHAQ